MDTTKLNSGYMISQKMALLLVTLGLVLMGMNMLLVQQNKILKTKFGADYSLELKVGKQLPPIEGTDGYGNRLRFDYGQDTRKTLLLVFSPGCQACEQNMPNWRTIIGRLDNEAYRVVGVSLRPGGVKEYIDRYNLPDLPVIDALDVKVRVAYGLVVTPQTILIGADGRAEKVWTGVLQEDEKEEVERILNGSIALSKE